WTGLLEFVDDTVTDYSRPSPTVASTSAEVQNKDTSTFEDVASPNLPKLFVKPNGAHMRPPHKSSSPRPHRDSMRPSFRPAGHRPHGPLMNPWRPTMNGARPYKSFFQAPSYETRPFLKSSAVKNPYRAPWVPTVNRKFTTGSTKNHNADMGRKGKAVKPSACWTWNPSQELSNKG
nr:hypothetical protein [Tanacetum cinerariifolium]